MMMMMMMMCMLVYNLMVLVLLFLIPCWDSLVLFARYPPINKDDPNRCQWRTSYISQANVSPRNHPGNRFKGCSNVRWFFCLEKLWIFSTTHVWMVSEYKACFWLLISLIGVFCFPCFGNQARLNICSRPQANAQREKLQDLRECKMAGRSWVKQCSWFGW